MHDALKGSANWLHWLHWLCCRWSCCNWSCRLGEAGFVKAGLHAMHPVVEEVYPSADQCRVPSAQKVFALAVHAPPTERKTMTDAVQALRRQTWLAVSLAMPWHELDAMDDWARWVCVHEAGGPVLVDGNCFLRLADDFAIGQGSDCIFKDMLGYTEHAIVSASDMLWENHNCG